MGRPKAPADRPPNPLRNKKPVINPTPMIRNPVPGVATRPAKRACPNKTCYTPQIEDGVCHSCGTIVDDSNIVAEVQFGESSSGAAVVQGSFVSADQGAAKSLGPAFRRAGGSEDRESTIREGKRIMQALANQLRIPESVVGSGVQIFKLAAMNNFIQGRRMDMVACVCLYSACRKEKPCRVMLIDFADKIQVNVFKLGHTFKALHKAVTLAKDGINPVLPEDLIYRFAMKLDFGRLTNKVATDASRMVQRMSLDWMVMGRRPSGVCGACLILAARMNNFRRTVTEVVYVVKVTTHTIQKRLEEFKLTPSSALTVEEFLNNQFLESMHDPPSFYEKSEEFQQKKKARKRKRKNHLGLEEEAEEEGGEETPNKRHKTTIVNPDEAVPTLELRRDADGFVIPPPPLQQQESSNIDPNIDPDLVDEVIADKTGTSINKLVQQFGDLVNEPQDDDDEELPSLAELTGAEPEKPRRGRPPERPIHVPEEWENDELSMESEINEMIGDPGTIYHAVSYAKAKKRAHVHMLTAAIANPPKNISNDRHIGPDEFADDPEVVNCLLPDEEVAKREIVWVNENKHWLRKQQIKAYQKKIAAQGPPKATRIRKRKPRIGEGQTSAASSPAEAAVAVLKERTWSKKINYDAIRSIFTDNSLGMNAFGSKGTSKRSSRAGSTVASSVMGDDQSERAESEAPGGSSAGSPNRRTTTSATTIGTTATAPGRKQGDATPEGSEASNSDSESEMPSMPRMSPILRRRAEAAAALEREREREREESAAPDHEEQEEEQQEGADDWRAGFRREPEKDEWGVIDDDMVGGYDDDDDDDEGGDEYGEAGYAGIDEVGGFGVDDD